MSNIVPFRKPPPRDVFVAAGKCGAVLRLTKLSNGGAQIGYEMPKQHEQCLDWIYRTTAWLRSDKGWTRRYIAIALDILELPAFATIPVGSTFRLDLAQWREEQ